MALRLLGKHNSQTIAILPGFELCPSPTADYQPILGWQQKLYASIFWNLSYVSTDNTVLQVLIYKT